MSELFQKKLYTHEEAERIAKILNDSEKMFNDNEEWTYIVKPDSRYPGYSFIEIYDEENEFVEYWTIV